MNDGESPFEVLARHQKEAPVNLDGIVRDLGLRLYRMDLGAGISGQLRKDRRLGGPSGYAILVNSADHPNRQRFTIAHEIAHYILHRDLIEDGLVDDTMYRSSLGDRYEGQANRLAADILMPVMLVKRMRARLGNDIVALARAFRVSQRAMQIRLESLTPAQPKLF